MSRLKETVARKQLSIAANTPNIGVTMKEVHFLPMFKIANMNQISETSVAMASQHPTSTTITLHSVLLNVTNPTNTILVDRNKGFPRGGGGNIFRHLATETVWGASQRCRAFIYWRVSHSDAHLHLRHAHSRAQDGAAPNNNITSTQCDIEPTCQNEHAIVSQNSKPPAVV